VTFPRGPVRTVVLVDGEHYPSVVRPALESLGRGGRDVVAAVMIGGTEKIGQGDTGDADDTADTADYGVPLLTGESPLSVVHAAIERFEPDAVYDLSDEPVLDGRLRQHLASHVLAGGVVYEGVDFRFDPPPRPPLATKPSVAVIGTGKRTGKTSISAHLARLLAAAGTAPVVVTMGRGGPVEPEVVDPGGQILDPAALVALAESGRHAASDHLEDAIVAGVVAIGTRRAGGGVAGTPGPNTFAAGVEIANARPEPLVVFEGSGAVVPPAHADATVCVVPAHAELELVTGYLRSTLLLLADLVVVTLAPQPLDPVAKALEDSVRELVPGTPVVRCTLEPHPLEPVSGRSVFFATTAPPDATARMAGRLETEHGVHIVGTSSNLANRALLREDLRAAEGAEVLLTELKAAAVDVATKVALERGLHVVYCDNRPIGTGGDVGIDAALLGLADQAVERFAPRRPANV